MQINPDIQAYLQGDKFSAGLEIPIQKTRYLPQTRIEIILKIVQHKSVIHVGCTDHLEIIDRKIDEDKWLHKLLTDQCDEVFGIDLNEESIRYVQEELGYRNLRRGDIISDDFPEIKSRTWDYSLFGELVEHLDNPVAFLSAFREKYQDHVDRFIITVPNILNKARFKQMKSYREIINTDHRFWFTPYTISKLITEAGMSPEKIYYGNLIPLNFTQLVLRKIKRILGLPVRYPYLYFNSLIVVGKLSND